MTLYNTQLKAHGHPINNGFPFAREWHQLNASTLSDNRTSRKVIAEFPIEAYFIYDSVSHRLKESKGLHCNLLKLLGSISRKRRHRDNLLYAATTIISIFIQKGLRLVRYMVPPCTASLTFACLVCCHLECQIGYFIVAAMIDL